MDPTSPASKAPDAQVPTAQAPTAQVPIGQAPKAQAPKVRLVRAPLVGVAVTMVLGVVLGRYGPFPSGLYAVCFAAAMVAAVVLFLRPHLHLAACAAVLAAVLCLSAAYVRYAYFSIPQDHIVTYTGEAPILATVSGQIVTWPQIVRDGPEVFSPYPREDRTCFIIQSSSIQTCDDPNHPDKTMERQVSGLVRVTVQEPSPRLSAGQHVQLVCRLGRFRAAQNPGQRDAAEVARENHTLVWAQVPVADGVIVQDSGPRPWYVQAYWHVRAACRQHLSSVGDEQTGHLVNALIIGERHPSLQTLNRLMVQAGVAHYLSISGSHLVIFLGFIYMLCRVLALSPRRAAAVVLVVLAAYMILAEPNAPLLRSAIMAGAICLAAVFNRRSFTPNALAAACIILLIADPLDLFSAGFQLSFGIVLGMLVLTRPIRDLLFGRWLSRRGLMVFRGDQRVARWLHFKAGDWLVQATAMSLAAYVASAPLVAYHFGLFSPYAAVLSLLLMLPIAAVLVSGYISMLLLWPMPNLSAVFGHMAAWSADRLAQCVGWMQGLPGLCFEMRPVGVVWVLVCYASVVLVLVRRRLPFGRFMSVAALAAVAALSVVTQRPAEAPPTAELHVLAVGAGQCAVLQTPCGNTFVFDAGTRSGFDAYQQALAPFLRERRLTPPTAVLISHANADHYNALAPLFRKTPPRRLFLNDWFGVGALQDPPLTELLIVMGQTKLDLQRLRAGMKVSLDQRTELEVLWPPAQDRREAPRRQDVNDTSLVVRVVCDGNSILLPGDISAQAQARLVASGTVPRCDAMVLPHHGSWTPSLDQLVKQVDPRVVIISDSRDPCPPPAQADSPAGRFFRELRSSHNCLGTWKAGCIRLRFGHGLVDAAPER